MGEGHAKSHPPFMLLREPGGGARAGGALLLFAAAAVSGCCSRAKRASGPALFGWAARGCERTRRRQGRSGLNASSWGPLTSDPARRQLEPGLARLLGASRAAWRPGTKTPVHLVIAIGGPPGGDRVSEVKWMGRVQLNDGRRGGAVGRPDRCQRLPLELVRACDGGLPSFGWPPALGVAARGEQGQVVVEGGRRGSTSDGQAVTVPEPVGRAADGGRAAATPSAGTRRRRLSSRPSLPDPPTASKPPRPGREADDGRTAEIVRSRSRERPPPGVRLALQTSRRQPRRAASPPTASHLSSQGGGERRPLEGSSSPGLHVSPLASLSRSSH